MDTRTSVKPKTVAELLPGLSGILTKNSLKTDKTAKRQPRQTIAPAHAAENVIKPLTVAEMRADILALRHQCPRKFVERVTFSNKKTWNSSVKVDRKTISHTANGQLRNNPVRKVLNFQLKPKRVVNFRATMAAELPNFPKPEFKAKKSLHIVAHDNEGTGGIYDISETPVVNMPMRSRTILVNEDNLSIQSNGKKSSPQMLFNPKELVAAIANTPLSDESWKSSCDGSFLQNEKDINDVEEKRRALSEEKPVSIPFKEYEIVQDFLHHSIDIDNSATFDFPSASKENRREESVIVSLCDLLNKTTVNNSQKNTELEDLLQIEEQTENNIKMIDNSVAALNKIKASQLTSLQFVRKLIKDKKYT